VSLCGKHFSLYLRCNDLQFHIHQLDCLFMYMAGEFLYFKKELVASDYQNAVFLRVYQFELLC
jgi:hypothetical protein